MPVAAECAADMSALVLIQALADQDRALTTVATLCVLHAVAEAATQQRDLESRRVADGGGFDAGGVHVGGNSRTVGKFLP